MSLGTADAGVVLASFLASGVELVEAFTIVLAMGVTRGWRSALAGTGAALAALAVLTAVGGVAVARFVPEAALQLAIGTLLLLFGLQWLRKAIQRAAGRRALHDEEAVFRAEREAALAAGAPPRSGLDGFGFTVAFKGVLLEGLEVVFIVVSAGVNAGSIPLAAAGAAAAGLVVLAAGVLLHRPLARVPENALKLVVGLMLTSFGTFWVVEGLGVFAPAGSSFAWPGGEAALLVVLAAWSTFAAVAIRRLRVRPAVA